MQWLYADSMAFQPSYNAMMSGINAGFLANPMDIPKC